MGIFNAISQWNANRYERKLNAMQEQGICPECRGRGLMSMVPSEFYYTNYAECPGCQGSGSYEDWAEVNQGNL